MSKNDLKTAPFLTFSAITDDQLAPFVTILGLQAQPGHLGHYDAAR